MPNGRPGDNPITDIVRHRLPVFGEEADGLIREVAALGGSEELQRERWIWGWAPATDEQLAWLRRLRDRLRGERPADGGDAKA